MNRFAAAPRGRRTPLTARPRPTLVLAALIFGLVGLILGARPASAQICGDGTACGSALATSASFSTPNTQALTASISIQAQSPEGANGVSGAVTVNPAHGSLSLGTLTTSAGAGPLGEDGAQAFTYTPNPGFIGTDSFQYTPYCGNCKNSFYATITITVTAPVGPAAPTANGGAISTAYNTPGSTTLSGGGSISGYVVASNPAHGSVSVAGATAVYTPNAGFSGSDSFTFIAQGPGGNSAPATISVSVGGPAAPSANPASISTAYNQTGSTTLSGSGLISGYAIATNPSHGSASLSGSTVSYTPAADYSGSDSFTIIAQGPGGNSAPATVSVSVGGPGPPSANNASISTSYDQAGSTTLSGSGLITGYALTSNPSAGSVSLNGSTVTYTPTFGDWGSYSFTFVAQGPGGNSSPATVTVNVSAPPAPSANAVSLTTAFGTRGSVGLSGAGVISSYALASHPSHGTASVSGSTAHYTPAANFYGSDSFTYTASGPGGTSAPATVSVTVSPPPAPSANNGAITVAYNSSGATGLSASGALISGYALASNAAHGSASVSGSTASYTPSPGFIGSDSFTYTVSNPGGSATATIFVTVQAPPPPSVSGASISTPFNTQGSTGLSGSGVISGFGLASGAANGSASVSGATAYYTPNTNFYGSDSFTIYAYGPGGNATAATVNVTVGKPPAPTAGSGSISAGFNTSGSTTLAGSGALISSYQVASGPAQGTVTISGSTVTYTPNPNTYGSDSFSYTVTNPGGTSSPATISVAIAKPPAPTVANGSISTAFDTPGSTTLAGSGALISSYQAASNPAHGTVSISGSTVTYTPNPTYYGTDSFSYTATNPGGTSSPATITVTVARPPAPTAANGAISTAFDTPGSTVLAGSGALVSSYQVGSGPAHGSVSIVGSTVTYTPTTDYYGADSFTYTVSNPGGTSRPATISVTVAPPPIPVAQSASVATPYLTPVTVPLAASGALISGYALATQPANGTVALSGSTATYTPNALFWGQDSFTFVATNPGGTSDPATISITVQLPPPPVVVSSNTTTPYQTPVTITLTSTGVGSTFAIASQPSLGVATLSGNVLTYTPNWGTAGVDTLTVTVSGPGGTSQPTNIYITNLPPPLPQGAGSYTGAPIPSSGSSTAVCPAVGTAAIPGLPGPPTGTAYDPNWCEEQALNIAQHALQLQNQLSQIANLQSQTEAQQKSLQALGSDATSPTLATINTAAAKILAQATGIGFNSASSGAAFAAAYPPSSTLAGFNNTQLSAALGAWQTNTAAALNTAVQVQNAVAQARASTTTAIQSAVTASNAAPGDTAAVQATNQLLAAITTQLGQLQDILVTEGQAQTAVDAAQQGAAGAAQAAAAQSTAATAKTVTTAPGVSNTDSL